MIAACLTVLVLAGLLVFQSRQQAAERAEWQRVEASLIQRIQAPELATMDHADVKPTPTIGFDNDEEFWASREDVHA